MLAHESRGHGHTGGEKLAIMKNEIDPEIDDIRTQHIRFDLVIDGITRRHFPDILKLRHDGVISVEEVKNDSRWKSDEGYRRVVEIAGDICREIGWTYDISTKADIAPSPRVRDNILQIQAERYIMVGGAEIVAVLTALRSANGHATMGDLKAVLGGRPGVQAIVKGMMCRGYLRIPLDGRLEDRTAISLFERCRAPCGITRLDVRASQVRLVRRRRLRRRSLAPGSAMAGRYAVHDADPPEHAILCRWRHPADCGMVPNRDVGGKDIHRKRCDPRTESGREAEGGSVRSGLQEGTDDPVRLLPHRRIGVL